MYYTKQGEDYIHVDPDKKLPPGTVLHTVSEGSISKYVEWTHDDLKDSKLVSFIPVPVPTLVSPLPYPDLHPRIIMDVNGLKQELVVGVMNTVPEMFYHAYQDSYETWRKNEDFKYTGPEKAAWDTGDRAKMHYSGWHYEPAAHSFGLDIYGRYLYAGLEYEEIEPGFLSPTGKTASIGLKVIKKPKRDAKGRFMKNTGE